MVRFLGRALTLLFAVPFVLLLAAEARAAPLPLTFVDKNLLVEATIPPYPLAESNGPIGRPSINICWTDPNAGAVSATTTYTGPTASPNLINLDFQVSVATGSLSFEAIEFLDDASATFTAPGSSGTDQILIQPNQSVTGSVFLPSNLNFLNITGLGLERENLSLLSPSTLTLMAGQTYTLFLEGNVFAGSTSDTQIGVSASLVPEPSTAALLAVGMVVVNLLMIRRKLA